MSGRIEIPGTHNFRDTGGYAAVGGTTRFGQLLRSDALNLVTPQGMDLLEDMNLGLIIDLRSAMEISSAGATPQVAGSLYLQIPVFGGSRSSMVSHDDLSLESLYLQTLTDAAEVLTTAVAAIADSGDRAVLVHCTAGKDRTGLVVALALSAAGVNRNAVVADYTQSALNLDGQWLDDTVCDLVSRGVPISPRLFEVLGGSPAQAMNRVLNWIDRTYGSVEGYLCAHGFPEDGVCALESKLIDGARTK